MKRAIAVFLTVMLAFLNLPAHAAEDVYIYVKPEDFSSLGAWQYEYSYTPARTNPTAALRGFHIVGAEGDSAMVTIDIPIDGIYYVWAHSYDSGIVDFSFNVKCEGILISELGKRETEGWDWELAGNVSLGSGVATISLESTNADQTQYPARVDALFITTDSGHTPVADDKLLTTTATHATNSDDYPVFPAHAKEQNTPTSTEILENSHVRYAFHSVNTSGGDVIQLEANIYSDEWHEARLRTDEYGWLLVYAQECERPIRPTEYGGEDVRPATIEQYPLWQSRYNNVKRLTADVYKAGVAEWLVPTSITRISDDTVQMTAENAVARVTVEYTLTADDKVAVITVNLEAKTAGSFSVGVFAGRETELHQLDNVLVPYRIYAKALPAKPYLVSENYASAPLSLMSLREGLTYAVVYDDQTNDFNWAKDPENKYGLSINGTQGGARPGLFAPMMGSAASNKQSGDTLSFTYREIAHMGGWYDVYRYVVDDIQGVTDYRQNYNATLNEAIDNTRALMMDDVAGGWDDVSKSFWNIEGKYVTSNAAPLALLQSYLLTDDEEILEKRAVPTIANMLTRGSTHSASTAEATIHDTAVGLSLAGPIPDYGTAVYGGAYAMTRNLTPSLKAVGIDSGVRMSALSFWSNLWYYKLTGNVSYLNTAKTQADIYINDYVDTPPSQIFSYESFVAMSAYPNFGALLDLYDETREQRYLDAAVKAARIMLTTVFTARVPDGDYTTIADDVRAKHFTKNSKLWKNDVQDRIGYPEGLDSLDDVTAPAWVVSRTGLSLEQTSTFRMHDSANIIMSSWAPDLMRLSHFTGDATFEKYARNAIIGRFANYPGYYYAQYTPYQMDENYPYVGPDITGVYYHHIPPFLSMLEGFLFAQAEKLSDGLVSFPYMRQYGYAYFSSLQYGFESGRFFDIDHMWAWLKSGLLTPANKQIDYLAARKDGTVAFALMNESNSSIATEITISAEATGGRLYSGNALCYQTDGTRSVVKVVNGTATVTLPARGLIGIAISASGIEPPTFASAKAVNITSGNTRVNEGDLLGHIIQLRPSEYYAYAALTNLPNGATKAILNYRINGGEWHNTEKSSLPYEFVTKVDDGTADFEYYIETKTTDNQTVSRSSQHTLTPITASIAVDKPDSQEVFIMDDGQPDPVSPVSAPVANTLIEQPNHTVRFSNDWTIRSQYGVGNQHCYTGNASSWVEYSLKNGAIAPGFYTVSYNVVPNGNNTRNAMLEVYSNGSQLAQYAIDMNPNSLGGTTFGAPTYIDLGVHYLRGDGTDYFILKAGSNDNTRADAIKLTPAAAPMDRNVVALGSVFAQDEFTNQSYIDILGGADRFEITQQPSHGVAILGRAGRWNYLPEADFIGNDSFIITAYRGTDRVELAVDIIVRNDCFTESIVYKTVDGESRYSTLAEASSQTVRTSATMRNLSANAQDSTILAALYHEGELVDVRENTQPINVETSQELSVDIEIPTHTAGYVLRVFVLENLLTMNPLGKSEPLQ